MDDKELQWLKFFTSLIKQVGFPGALTLIFLSIFIFIFSDAQQIKFIDNFILFENYAENSKHCVISLSFFIFVIIVISIFYKKDMKIKKSENNRIGKEKTELMKILLERENLSSSD